jgi:hypothetical protein
MAKHELPRRGSRPANGLSALHSLGGRAGIAALYRVAGKSISRTCFDMLVIEQLVFYGLIEKNDNDVQLTDAGRAYLGIAKPTEVWVGKVPEPRTGNGFKPLRARSAMVFRAGAFDYRNLPSMMGGVEVPYKSTATEASA